MPRAVLATLATLAVTAMASAPARAQGTDSASVRQLSLEDALGMAERVSDDVAIAQAGVVRARGQQEKARSQYLPQITASASYTRTLKSQFEGLGGGGDSTSGPPDCSTFPIDSTAPLAERVSVLERALGCTSNGGGIDFSQAGFGAANQFNLGLNLSQNLFAGGRIRAQTRQAGAARQSAEIGLTSARAQLVLDVAQAYYDAALGDRLLTIAQATLAQADTTLAQTRLARQVGNQPEFELLRAQVTRDNQVPVVIRQRSQRDIAYVRLQQLLQLPLDQPLALTTELGDTSSAVGAQLASILNAVPDTSVSRRAPVRQASQNVVAQRNAVTVARSQRIPTLTLSSAYGRVAFPPNGLPDWNQFRTNWTITGTLSVPLFTGGSIHADQVIAQSDLREAEARLRKTQKAAELDTRDALAQLTAAAAQFQASVGTVEQASRAYQIAEVRYREGISTQTELTDSRLQLQQAQANRAQASRDFQVARMRVALLRDLPIAGGAGTAQPSTQQTPPPLTIPQQTPGQRSPTQPSVTGAAQASQVGITP